MTIRQNLPLHLFGCITAKPLEEAVRGIARLGPQGFEP